MSRSHDEKEDEEQRAEGMPQRIQVEGSGSHEGKDAHNLINLYQYLGIDDFAEIPVVTEALINAISHLNLNAGAAKNPEDIVGKIRFY